MCKFVTKKEKEQQQQQHKPQFYYLDVHSCPIYEIPIQIYIVALIQKLKHLYIKNNVSQNKQEITLSSSTWPLPFQIILEI